MKQTLNQQVIYHLHLLSSWFNLSINFIHIPKIFPTLLPDWSTCVAENNSGLLLLQQVWLTGHLVSETSAVSSASLDYVTHWGTLYCTLWYVSNEVYNTTHCTTHLVTSVKHQDIPS